VTRPRLRVVVRAEEAAAITALGLATLRRLKTGDPAAPGWPVIARLLRPLDTVNAGLDSPPTSHRRRAMLDVVALLLTRCAKPGAGSYWDWTAEQWAAMRFYDWALVRLGGNLRVTDETPADGFAHTLLLRRSITDPDDVTYFLAHAPDPSPAATLIRIAGTRWKIEENNEQGKDLIGIDQYQVRTWTAWQHTITVCMFAHAFVAVQHATLHRDTATSTDTHTPTGDQATGLGKAAAQRQPARQAPTG
jgi:hypothetical protein